jgi:hypothetical protein
MRNSTVYLNIPMQARWAWLEAEKAEYNALMNQPGKAYHDHIYTTIQNEFSNKLKVSNVAILIRLVKSLSTTTFRKDAPDDWSIAFTEIHRAIKRFSLTKDEIAELSQYIEVPRTIEKDFYATEWRVVTGVSSGLQTDVLGREKSFIFLDMDSETNRKRVATASCIKLWEGFPDANGDLPGVKPALADALAMAASKDMYAALVAVMNSGVQLPDDVQDQLGKAFDKANGDYFYKTTN